MMLSKIIFFIAVSAAILVVILLALFSPSVQKKPQKGQSAGLNWLALSLYVQPPQSPNPPNQHKTLHRSSAFVFHHKLTDGPENTSRVIGRARGFVLPVEHSALAAFNIIYLTFETSEYSGSLGIEAKKLTSGIEEELMVVGGTGSFAFASGVAVLVRTARPQSAANADAMYNIKLSLSFLGQS